MVGVLTMNLVVLQAAMPLAVSQALAEEPLEETEEVIEETEEVLEEEGEEEQEENNEEEGNNEKETKVEIENENDADVDNEATSDANTGDNEANNNGEESVDEEEDECEVHEEENNEEGEGDENNEGKKKCPPKEENEEETAELNEEGEEVELNEEAAAIEETEEEETSNEEEEENQEENGEEGDEENNDEVIIETGDAQAEANIYNEVNTNIVGENWEDLVENIYGYSEEDINLLEIILKLIGLMDEEENNEEEDGGPDELVIENKNQADIENDAEANANSGRNEANENEGDVEINTGNAQAVVNVVNIVNTNIVGDNWVFVVINVFGHWSGDLIVPGEGLLSFPFFNNEYSSVEIENVNQADIENDAGASANSGDNEANGNDGDVEIETGDAFAQSQVETQANTNIVGSNWFSLTINENGNWWGKILNWFGDEGDELGYVFLADEEGQGDAKLTVKNYNLANITNTAQANANTGENQANQNGGDVAINTGNAGAFSNIFNLVNTNIVGSNWLFGVVNVMGEWTGDLEFAYPELEVEIDDGKEELEAGEQNEYTVKFRNNGKADAENVSLAMSLNGGEMGGKKSHTWDLGSVPSGQAGEMKVIVKSENGPEILFAEVEIVTETEEKEKGNNSDSDETKLYYNYEGEYNEYEYGYEVESYLGPDSSLKVKREKTISAPVVNGQIVYHVIYVENDGDSTIYDVKLSDRLFNDAGVEIAKYVWPLGDMEEGAEYMIEYMLLINNSASAGIYEFVAKAKGDDPMDDEVRSGKAILAMQVVNEGYYVGAEEGEPPFELVPAAQAAPVLGVSDAKACAALPLWIWIAALVSYGLAVNWSLFRWNNKELELGGMRKYVVPAAFTIGGLVLWWIYRCDAMLWFPITLLAILLVHLLVKRKKQKSAVAIEGSPQKA